MTYLLAQAATQSVNPWTVWTPAEVIAVIGALSAAVVAVIAAVRGKDNTARLNRQGARQDRLESDQKTIALHTPAPVRPATPHDPPSLNRGNP